MTTIQQTVPGSGNIFTATGDVRVNVYENVRAQPVDETTLAAAESKLAALPLDSLPAPSPLPHGSRVTHSRNPLFVGREQDLKQLAAALKGGATAAIGQIAAATGLGGIGKSQLAVEFAHRYGRYFAGGVFWISLANPEAVEAEVAACGGAGALDLRPDFSALKLDEQVREVLAAWQSPLPRLLIFDNCESEALLAQWRPPTGGSRVLVTSRRAEWEPALGVTALALGVLARAESVSLLRKFRPELASGDLDLRAIALELGDLPLALHLAGSYLHHYRHSRKGTPAAVLVELRRPDLLEYKALQGAGTEFSPTGHESHVARTFALSYKQLKPDDSQDAVAIRALARAACFAPGEPIPRDLLKASLAAADGDAAELQVEDALARLAGLGLLESEAGGALRLHRLLAAFVNAVGADPQAAEAVEEILFAEAARINQEGYPAPLLAWQAHLRFVADRAETRGSAQAGNLLNELGYHLDMIGDYTGARAAYERALKRDEAAFGPDHPDVAKFVNNLGLVLHALGDHAGARAAFERALKIDETALGPDHPDVARDVNNLGTVLRDLGDYTGARAAYERALKIVEAALGSEHPNVAIFVNNLGTVLRDLGDHAGARAAYERALKIDEAAFGPDHPNVAIRVNNLGGVLRALGDHAGARAAFERALKIFESAFGPGHPRTRTVRANLESLPPG